MHVNKYYHQRQAFDNQSLHLYLKYVQTAKAANCDQGFPSSDWSKLNFLLSHEINPVQLSTR